MSTIKDIAKRAGVSTATVSYVLNGNRYVSDDLKERVLTVVAELDYRPNAVAQSLRQKKTRTIGLLVPDNSNPFFAEVAKGVEDAGFESGVSVILCNSDGSFNRELRYLQLLRDKQVDGIILMPTTPRTDHIASIVERTIPVVIFYRQVPDLNIDSLVVDNFGGGYLATRHLVELGHTQIACVAPASIKSPSSLRVIGFRKAMEDAGLPVDESLIFRGDNRFAGGRDGATHLIASGKPFTAVFAGNDVMAIGTIRTLQQHGMKVPEDVSVVGFDGIALGDYISPSLTTIVQPRFDAGQTSFRLLLERIDGGNAEPRREIVLKTELVVRESTATPRPGGAR
jgi:LacI family transcriptional regulator